MKKGPNRKKIEPLEAELHLNGLLARWGEIHGKAALQLLKIAELITRSHMPSGTTQQLKTAATELDAWCAVHYDNTKDWQRLKTYVRVAKHNDAHGLKKGATADLFATRKAQAQSVSKKPKKSAADKLAEKAWGKDSD